MDRITVVGRVVHIGIRRIVRTKFGEALVATAVLEDDSGRIALNLWRDHADMVKEGDVIRVENGFVRVYQELLELNLEAG
jgi:replication factor A1